MSALTRKFKKIFAKDSANNGVFGSAAALAPATSTDPETIESLGAFLTGWEDATEGGLRLPTLEDTQGLKYDTDYHLAYMYQEGIAEYNSQTEYQQYSIVKKTGTTELYRSLANINTGNPLTDITKWALCGNLAYLPTAALGTAAYVNTGTSSGNVPLVGTRSATASLAGLALLRKQITVANNVSDSAHDIDFGAGTFLFSDGTGQGIVSALTKRSDATWASGNGNGGMAAGQSVPATGTIYMFALSNSLATLGDFGFDTSASATNLIADSAVTTYFGGTPKWQLIAKARTDGSGNILNGTWCFNPDGSYNFYYATVTQPVNVANPATSEVLFSLPVPPSTIPLAQYIFGDSGSGGYKYALFTSPLAGNSTPSSSLFTNVINTSNCIYSFNSQPLKTNSSSQIRFRCTSSDANTFYAVTLAGWFDAIIS